MRYLIAPLLGASLLSAPAFAGDPPAAAPAQEKKICRKEDPPTGSHRPPKKVCLTAAEWRARDGESRDSSEPGERRTSFGGGSDDAN